MINLGLFTAEKVKNHDPAKGLFALQFLVVGIGTAILFSASWYFSRTVFDDPFFIWRRQLVRLLLGFLVGIVVYRMPKELIQKSTPILVCLALGLNLLTYVPGLGHYSGGARRWIEVFGLTFQPSEITRVALILYLARMFEKNKNRMANVRNGLLPSFLVALVLVLVVYFQNDFSTAAYLFVLTMGLFFVAGASWRWLCASLGLAVLAATSMLLVKPYRLERFVSWLDPLGDPTGTGYQFLRTRMALEQGGFWGLGLGRGVIKRGGIPAAHSDFVVAVIGEEMGFLGIVLVLILFTIFAVKGWAIAEKQEDIFSRWAIFGLTAAIYWQVLVNLAVVSGSLPATGIPLPFFSAGGSAAFMTVIMFALILNFSRSNSVSKSTRPEGLL